MSMAQRKDDVGAAGETHGDRDPAGVASHDFILHARVRFGGGVEAINGLGGDGDWRCQSRSSAERSLSMVLGTPTQGTPRAMSSTEMDCVSSHPRGR